MIKNFITATQKFIKTKLPHKRVYIPLLILGFSILGFITASRVSADTITWTGNGTSNGLCSTVSSDPTITGQDWQFILTSPDGNGTYVLSTSFDPAAQTPSSPYTVTKSGNGAVHFIINTTIGAKLLSASVTGGTSNSTLTVSDCTVGKGTSNVSTTLHNASESVVSVGSSVVLGSIMHDLATVTSSGTAPPTGNVSFTFYNNGTCDGSGITAGSVALDGANPGVAHPSDSTSALAAGSYGFKASWPGDNNYTGNTSDCENFNVSKAQLSTDTHIHDATHSIVTTASLGSVVHDTASLNGVVNGFSAPAITFIFYTNGGCSGDGTSVTNTGADQGDASLVRSADSSALAAGSYAYKASVAGNDNYLGDSSECEPLTVNKAQLSVTTVAHDADHNDITGSSVPLGSITHDTATVSGGVDGFPLPTTSFSLTTNYTDSCSSGSTVALDGTDPGNDGIKSADSAILGAGQYAYRASVAGNDNYIGSDSDCEPFTVNKATLSLTTAIHDIDHNVISSIDAGGTVHDLANVSGINVNFVPLNNVTFTLYSGGDCTNGTPESAGSQPIVNGVAHPSTSEGPLNAGSYAFSAAYDGTSDPNYDSAASDCEPLTVNKVTPAINTAPNPSSGLVGVSLNDSGTLSGGFNLTGNISFELFSPSDPTCANTPIFTNVVTVSGGGTYNTGAGFNSNAAGTWRWVAVYSGDTNNNSVTSGCNDEQVTITTPITRTLGFWQTHFNFTNSVYSASGGSSNPIWTICSGRVITNNSGNNMSVLYGGFYASIPKLSTGGKRSALDQARMQLMQQLLAAILNNLAFGGGNSLITAAKTAYCGTNTSVILNQVTILDNFNQSSDTQSISQNTGSADPKASSAAANLVSWDILP